MSLSSQCSCGDKIPSAENKEPDSSCDSPCAGDASEKCGGKSSVIIYATTIKGKKHVLFTKKKSILIFLSKK